MSLLQNEDFALYQLRTAYLSSIRDGIGERLIAVNNSILNNPAFRAAGWVPNLTEPKRTYSPPIPTAITSTYFQGPSRVAGSDEEDDEDGGIAPGEHAVNDALTPTLTEKGRRRKEQLEEDDSSDLSDESEDENDRAARQIKFSKMPLRTRAGSSPLRGSRLPDGPSLLVTSPSRPSESSRLRRGSLGAVEAIKERARRDTATSSDLSSDTDLDPSLFKRKKLNSHRTAQSNNMLSQRIQEDDREEQLHIQPDDGRESEGSTLSSGFSASPDSNSFLGEAAHPLNSSPSRVIENIRAPIASQDDSRKPGRQAPALLQALPPPRPISVIQPVSALSLAIKAKIGGPRSPFERYATLSGKGDPSPLYIKLYVPFSNKPSTPIELLLRRTSDEGDKVTVADAIGFSLWRYAEERLEPPVRKELTGINHWTLRMVEDGDVDFDFPALARTRPIADFTSNNNRVMRGKSKDIPWDEFALVEATTEQFKENEGLTPDLAALEAVEQEDGEPDAKSRPSASIRPPFRSFEPSLGAFHNPITGRSLISDPYRKDSTHLLDAPTVSASHSTPRTGAAKVLLIRFTDNDFNLQKVSIGVTTDTYIAEVLDQTCKRLNIDKGLYILKVAGTSTVAPLDRTVEALGDHSTLDIVRRRFVGDVNFGISASPGSSSPNAPLLISAGGTPRKSRKGAQPQPLTQKHDHQSSLSAINSANYKRYAVTRKQPMSFNSSSSRILALDEEFMHVMPGENVGGTKALFDSTPKTVSIHFSSVVGSKVSRRHLRNFRVMVFRERETKRYDFEAATEADAHDIVRDIKKGMERFQDEVT